MSLQKRDGFAVLILFFAVIAVYSNVYEFTFLYDDEFLIQKNRFLDSFSYLPELFSSSSTAGAHFVDSFYRPLQGLSYLIINQIFGKEPWAFHALNVVLHFINAVLVWRLGLALKLHNKTALIAALLWALHPLHVEGVTYMSATADPLHVMFLLFASLAALPDFSAKRIALSAFFFICGLLSKESSVVFPALLITLIFMVSPNRRDWRVYLRSIPLWLIAFAYLGLRQTILNFNQDFSMYKQANAYTESILNRISTFFATLPSYATLLVWPDQLSIDRYFPMYDNFTSPLVIAGAVIFALCLFLALRPWFGPQEKGVWAAWVALWFGCAHFPHTGVLIPVNSFFLEHWMYLPSISLFLGLARAGEALCEKKQALAIPLVVTAGICALALGTRTYLQNRIWESSITLFSHILEMNPTADRVRHNLAMAYSAEGSDDKALETYQKILGSGRSSYPQTYHNMARIFAGKGQLKKAEELYLEALKLDPRFHPSYADLAAVYAAMGEKQKSEEMLKKYRDLVPSP